MFSAWSSRWCLHCAAYTDIRYWTLHVTYIGNNDELCNHACLSKHCGIPHWHSRENIKRTSSCHIGRLQQGIFSGVDAIYFMLIHEVFTFGRNWVTESLQHDRHALMSKPEWSMLIIISIMHNVKSLMSINIQGHVG